MQADEDPAVLRRHAQDALILPRAYPVAQAFVAQMATLAEKAAAGSVISRVGGFHWSGKSEISALLFLYGICVNLSSRMLKKSASGVLASLRGSTYRSVRLASSLAAALLDSLFDHPEVILASALYGKFQPHFGINRVFPQPARPPYS